MTSRRAVQKGARRAVPDGARGATPNNPPAPRPRWWLEIAAGVGTVLRGVRVWARDPRSMLLGVLPGLAAGLLMAVGWIVLISNAPAIGDWVGRAAVGDGGAVASVVAAAAALAIIIAGTVIAVVLFTTLALAIGQPAFEAISRRVDAAEGGLDPAPEERWWVTAFRGLGDAVIALALSVVLSLALLLLGLIPVIGGAVSLTVGAAVGGRLIVLELTAYAMARRGIVTRQGRARALRPWRARTLGFGALVFLAFMVPLGALVTMPVAVAGATLLSRDVTGGLPGVRQGAVRSIAPSPEPPGSR